MRLIIISGLSGSGKTTAIKAVEDLGFFCIDNLPIIFLEKFILLGKENQEINSTAIVIDIRSKQFLNMFPSVINRLKQMGVKPYIVFLSCSDETIIKRYSETRRIHPLQKEGNFKQALENEKIALAPIRNMADIVVDTTNSTVHELRKRILSIINTAGKDLFSISIESFGFKYGIPMNMDYIFDVRCLPNPYFIETLRKQTGKDKPVADYLDTEKEVRLYLKQLESFLSMSVPLHRKEGRFELKVGIGCTGGRHRSVYIAEKLYSFIKNSGNECLKMHRDINK